MAGRAFVTYTSDPRDDPKKITLGVRDGLRKAAAHWGKVFGPLHFRRGAARKYGYADRSDGYNRAKLRVFHHRKPLVWTGTSERWLRTRRAQPRIVKTAGGLQGRLAILMPRYFFAFRTDRNATDKVIEVTTTTQDEAEVLGGIVADGVDAKLAKTRRKRRRL